MSYPELSRRVARVLNTVRIAGAHPDLRRRIVAEAERAESFDDLSAETQEIIIEAEHERDQLDLIMELQHEKDQLTAPTVTSTTATAPPRGTRGAATNVKRVSGTLCDGDVAGTNVYQSISYTPDKGIEISGSDYGRAPKRVFGSSEYEYWRTVKPKYVGRVFFELLKEAGLPHERMSGERLIDLICTRFGGDHHAEKRFRMWCEDKGIPTEFFSWVSGE